jgi:hypothetical protein
MTIHSEHSPDSSRHIRRRGRLWTGAGIAVAGVCAASIAIALPASALVGNNNSSGNSNSPGDSNGSGSGGGRGTPVSQTALATLAAKSDVDAFLTDQQFDPGTDRYGVRTYRLVYRTIDTSGRPTTASGLVALPINGERQLRTVSFAHGTEIYKGDAPSTSSDGFLTGPAITFASAGFAAVAPDYLGLGEGPGTHPWMDVASETTASLDMLRAARTFVAGTGRQLQREVLVSGFSQGASAALGLGRALQGGADPWFRVGALAPISGAYDFWHAEIPALLTQGELNAKLGVAYTAYLLVSYNRLHHIYDSPSEVFQHDYVNVAKLFDGTTPALNVLGGLPNTLPELLTKRGYALIEHPTGVFAAALTQLYSVCTDWTPKGPVHLYLSPGDEEAANANTYHCHSALTAYGAQAPIENLGVNKSYNGFIHEGSEVLGTAAVTRWFSTLN